MDCTVSIVRQLAEDVFFSLVIILDYGHFEKSFIFFHFPDFDYICTPNLVASMEFVGKSMILKYQFL